MKYNVTGNILTMEIPLVTEEQYPWRDNESIDKYEQRLSDIANIRARDILTFTEEVIKGGDSKPWRHG